MTTHTDSQKPAMKNLFKNRVVMTIMLSTLFLQIGIWIRNYSILLYVIEKTNENPVAVSMISVAEFAPIFLFSFIGGTFADRWLPKRTMVWCDLLSAVSIFVVLITLMLGSWKVIFFATLVSSVLSQFSQPSGMKLFKLHVPDEIIQLGMSMYQTIFALFMILGPVLGTFVYQHFGIHTAIAMMGVAFLCSAAVLLLLPADRKTEEDQMRKTLPQEMKDGFRYVWKSKSLTLLGGCFMAAGLAIGLTQTLGVFLITERLDLNFCPASRHRYFYFNAATKKGGSNGEGHTKNLEAIRQYQKETMILPLLSFISSFHFLNSLIPAFKNVFRVI